ncbi:MAG: hypothetical protein ACRBN8_41500 [Nannocystales bacterium]
MPGDRTMMPSAARARRGWRAGLRAQSRWLDTAAGLAAVGLVLGAIPWSTVSGWGARWQAAVVQPALMGPLLVEAAWGAAAIGLALCLGFGAARVLCAGLTGRVGAVERSLLPRLRPAPVGSGALPLVLLSLIALLGVGVAVRGVAAGSARSVDATARGVLALWTSWPQRAWVAALIVLGIVGWVELVLSRRRITAALAQTRQQVRDDLKARSGGHR